MKTKNAQNQSTLKTNQLNFRIIIVLMGLIAAAFILTNNNPLTTNDNSLLTTSLNNAASASHNHIITDLAKGNSGLSQLSAFSLLR